MNSETPRTDAAEIGYRDKQRVPADFARQLERENKILRAALKNSRGQLLGRNGLDRDADNFAASEINKALAATPNGES